MEGGVGVDGGVKAEGGFEKGGCCFPLGFGIGVQCRLPAPHTAFVCSQDRACGLEFLCPPLKEARSLLRSAVHYEGHKVSVTSVFGQHSHKPTCLWCLFALLLSLCLSVRLKWDASSVLHNASLPFPRTLCFHAWVFIFYIKRTLKICILKSPLQAGVLKYFVGFFFCTSVIVSVVWFRTC